MDKKKEMKVSHQKKKEEVESDKILDSWKQEPLGVRQAELYGPVTISVMKASWWQAICGLINNTKKARF